MQAALESALATNPDDITAHSAYADYLQEQTDPGLAARGEFVSVQLAMEDTNRSPAERQRLQQRERELLQAHQREWLGDLAPALLDNVGGAPEEERSRMCTGLQFRRGWLGALDLWHLPYQVAAILARSPAARLLRELTIQDASYHDWQGDPDPGVPTDEYQLGLVPLCAAPALRNVRVFRLQEAEEDGDEYALFSCYMGSRHIPDIVDQMPQLEELYLFSNHYNLTELFSLPLPRLRILQVYHVNQVHRLDVLAQNEDMANLTHLLLHPHCLAWHRNQEIDEPDGFSEEGGYLPLSMACSLLYSDNFPHLRHLRLRVSSMGDAGCEEIVRSGILKRLETLDLRHGCITDAGVRTLARCPDLLNLKFLDLRRNFLSLEGIRLLESLSLNVHAFDQLDPTRATPDPIYLYEGESE
jgi:uncharacterized protein (TIGR02996 family)